MATRTTPPRLADLEAGVIELALHRTPCNELGSLSLEELEQFASVLGEAESISHALIVHSELESGFCAGADLRDIAFSLGSACASGSGRPSHVLRALGLDYSETRSSIRLGFGRYTTQAELVDACHRLAKVALEQEKLDA